MFVYLYLLWVFAWVSFSKVFGHKVWHRRVLGSNGVKPETKILFEGQKLSDININIRILSHIYNI